ncbi:MAG: CvpA family protein [Acetobacteraceae bacterium]|nr:CvpA family protein [Acetobacteraceae bacterium]
MPWFDVVVLLVLGLSGLLALLRGFVREILAIGAWIGAAAAGLFGYPLLAPQLVGLGGLIEPGLVANALAGGAIFLVALIVLSLVAGSLGDLVQGSRLGALDRTLGLAFGLVRGAVILCFAYIAAAWLAPPDRWPDWATQARTLPALDAGGRWIVRQLPEGLLPLPPPVQTAPARQGGRAH